MEAEQYYECSKKYKKTISEEKNEQKDELRNNVKQKIKLSNLQKSKLHENNAPSRIF